MNNKCFNCDKEGVEFYGYPICDSCKKELRLFTDATIEKHIKKKSKLSYKIDILDKLDLLDNKYIKAKIKLLDILSKLEK